MTRAGSFLALLLGCGQLLISCTGASEAAPAVSALPEDVERLQRLEARVDELVATLQSEAPAARSAAAVKQEALSPLANAALGLGGTYAALIFVGGLIGYVKAKSKASLIAGTACAVMVGGAVAVGCLGSEKPGLIAESALSLLMTVMFAKKYLDSGKVFPGLVLAVTGAVCAALAAIAADQAR
eukprot:CAMPEP_0115106474 /NCGR_PEP_ID=MMETSP0227-20121206/36679_1 /TAXON_ID=89957 /ORGANISM="Polarella glacialis, Strain CCMP 1383" /LENGTH=183 /DNA_ID=CAMNT_0002504083 /DNA_START=48 /DNA_END=599 /DNA_ORIENTATION=-